MKKYTVQCGYAGYYANTVTVEAETIEEACAKAVEEAGNDSGWKSLDHCGDTYVEAIAEGEDVDPWAPAGAGSALPVPFAHTEAQQHIGGLVADLVDVVERFQAACNTYLPAATHQAFCGLFSSAREVVAKARGEIPAQDPPAGVSATPGRTVPPYDGERFAHTPERCPSMHHNRGDDVCADCGENLN